MKLITKAHTHTMAYISTTNSLEAQIRRTTIFNPLKENINKPKLTRNAHTPI